MEYENNNHLSSYIAMLIDVGKDFSVTNTTASTYVNVTSDGLPIISMEFSNVTNKLINIFAK
ncbi:MAG: hypothetical protein EOM34_00040 [Clostridia bacterium]|nr:hypothetical protein [Lachnospiraceae bacterium]NCB99055.1 hypothetical protein [Clostridia bacterium]NCD03511.1 hypothetical protein [Clostridia bacterium]